MPNTHTGLDRLAAQPTLLKNYSGNFGYLCNSTSIDRQFRHGIGILKEHFGKRLTTVFAPQHGLLTQAQDNMIESPHFYHEHYELPVYSLYSDVRQPTAAMLEDIDHLIIDLQDVGVRVYTYIQTAFLAIEACGRHGVNVIVLDRPNPLGGMEVAGNMLDPAFKSFIGLHPLPMQHGMSIGELARLAVAKWGIDCELEVIEMEGWRRKMTFADTGLPWVLPSPNFPSLDTALVYPGTVLLEGTNLSEGRGTVRPFELFGHPHMKPYEFLEALQAAFSESGLKGVALRPLSFKPTFDKYAASTVRGYQLHVTDPVSFRPWHTAQVLLRELFHLMGDHFIWREPPFEYESQKLPIDILNGTDQLRLWVDRRGAFEELEAIERQGRVAFMEDRRAALLYP